MNIYLSWLYTILYCIAYPVYWILCVIAIALLYVLRPIFFLIVYLLQPVVYLGAFIAYMAQLPYQFLKRFETLYVFLGVGGLVGLACGLLLHYTLRYLTKEFSLRSESRPRGPAPKKDRVARQQQKKMAAPDSVYATPEILYDDSPPRGRKGLLDQTIYEEIDSDF